MKVTRQFEINPHKFEFDYNHKEIKVSCTEKTNDDEPDFLPHFQYLQLNEEGRRLIEALKFWIERNLK